MHAASDPSIALPDALPLLRARVTLRLLEDAALPAYKGAMLRGGFGYAFQRVTCPSLCWGRSEQCAVESLCPYRWVFETPRPAGVERLHDLQDIPRPFVLEPPTDGRVEYAAGEALEFGLVLIGRGVEYLPYFLFGFEQFGRAGLGRQHARAWLERVEALPAWAPVGEAIYQDGRALADAHALPLIDGATIAARAAALPADLRLTLLSPLRLKARGDFLRALDVPALVQAACWRLHTLALFHGGGAWEVDHRRLIEQARAVGVEQAQLRWLDLLRTSTRGPRQETMPQGGLLGSAVLRGVSEDVRAVLLAGSVIHVGKACTFGHGGYGLSVV
ncbi:MAG TPA: CRISPR system precrRNA processing endoribonuclease RAMP protein Cas6 [Roseiflexaceae bacterium]|nr:CRISPR system precrRNA processing endoribonuclease RAMP protein Cas6 [Roseiflexaceae bacterium]